MGKFRKAVSSLFNQKSLNLEVTKFRKHSNGAYLYDAGPFMVWLNNCNGEYELLVSGCNGPLQKAVNALLPSPLTARRLQKAFRIIESEIEKYLDKIHCPVCRQPSSSIAHFAGHAHQVDNEAEADFGTSWRTPNGASGQYYWKIDPGVPEEWRARIVGAVADYRAEHIDFSTAGQTSTVVSTLFGRA